MKEAALYMNHPDISKPYPRKGTETIASPLKINNA